MKTKILSLIAGAFILSAAVTSCTKDPQKPHEEHNHDDPTKVEMLFIKGHYHGTSLHAHDTTKVVMRWDGKFIDPTTNALLTAPPEVKMEKGYDIYKLKVNFYDAKGKLLNGEFIEEANIHQFFFLPKAGGEGALSYEYKDANNIRLGFDGDFKVLQTSKTFDMDVVLMHGLKKTTNIEWNDVNYKKFGGSPDFITTLKIKTVEGEAHADH